MRIMPLFGAVLFLAAYAAHADVSVAPHELDLIKGYMLNKDYPEKFGDKSYHVEINDVIVAPILNDGSRDVVVRVTPTYRQSATILIYEIGADDSVSRVTEGLAPGPLVAVSGDYIDSHTLGQAFDVLAPNEAKNPGARAKIMASGLENLGGFVAYKNFFHGDGRNGPTWFLDMSDADSPLMGDNCEGFEFSRVDAIAAGQLDGGGKQTYLVARVGKQLYFYLIAGLRDGKFLNKKTWNTAVPDDFKTFTRRDPSPITYITQDGQTKLLAAPR